MSKVVTVFAGAHCSPEKEVLYLNLAHETGTLLAKNGFTVATGAGSGLMDEVLRGAKEVGGEIVGVGLSWATPSKHVTNHTVFDKLSPRQDKLIQLGDAYIALPGGVGTLYEIFNILALKRIEEMPLGKQLILIGDYYDQLDPMIEMMIGEGFVGEAVRSYFHRVKTPKEAINLLLNC